MSEAQELAKELTKRRLGITGARFSVRDALAEVLFLQNYNIVPSIDNLNRQMFLIFEDGAAQKLQIIPFKDGKVSFEFLDEEADIIVLVTIRDRKVVGGYISRSQLEESVKDDDGYVVQTASLWEFPKEFVFKTCDEPCMNAAVWDYEQVGWDCFWCDRLRLDRKGRSSYGSLDDWNEKQELSSTAHREIRGEGEEEA